MKSGYSQRRYICNQRERVQWENSSGVSKVSQINEFILQQRGDKNIKGEEGREERKEGEREGRKLVRDQRTQ